MAASADVVIAGGGVAGASVAAALGEFGYSVIVVEPGIDEARRLAGELIHPPGVSALAELGLLEPLEQAGVVPVVGFFVFPDAGSTGEACGLRYADAPGLKNQGFAMEHAALRTTLLRSIANFPHVKVWNGARIVGVDLTDPNLASVRISMENRQETLRCRMLVAADGGASKISQMAGIGHRRVRISYMKGYVLRGAHLPQPGYGNAFLGGPAPAFAYSTSPETVRVMFDIPDNPDGLAAVERDSRYIEALPEPFQSEVRDAVRTRSALVSANYSFVPDDVVRGRLVLVGDAGGCCHPLTATGMTVCTADAMRLRNAIRESAGDLSAALRLYVRRRERPLRTRRALAEALYATFRANTPEMHVLRQGLIRYWRQSPKGRAASMALLSTYEGRMSVMARQYAHVAWYGLTQPVCWREASSVQWLTMRGRAVFGLSLTTLKYAGEALRP